MHASDSQGQRIAPPTETMFSELLGALEQRSIAVGRDRQHANTLYMSPKSAGEVVEVIKLCSRTHTPISICYGTEGAANPEPRVYLNLQRLDTITPVSATRYWVGLGATVAQLKQTPLHKLVSDDIAQRYPGQCLGQLLLQQLPLHTQGVEQRVVGLIAVLPDGQLWTSRNEEQQCASERLLNALFLAESNAALSVLLALELELNPDQWLINGPLFGGADASPMGTGSAARQVISRLKEALDPNRILNGTTRVAQGNDVSGAL